MKKKILNPIILVLMAALLISACAASEEPADAEPLAEPTIFSTDVISEGRLEPAHATNLTFQARGLVEEVFVQAGDAVKTGDVLARLSNAGQAEAQVLMAQNAYDALLRNESGERASLWDAYMKAQSARAAAEVKWEDFDEDATQDRIDDLEAEIEDLKEELDTAEEEFDKYKDLDEDNSRRKTAEDDLEAAQEALNDKVRELEEETRSRDEIKSAYEAALSAEIEAKYQYEITLDGPNADKLALAKANLDAAQDVLSGYVLTAPFNGVVADVNVKAGEQVGAETRVVSIVDTSAWFVETTDVTELEVVNISLGQAVTIRPDALPELELSGVVTEISNAYTQTGGDILYTVRIRIDTPDTRLKWGMTAETIFRTSE